MLHPRPTLSPTPLHQPDVMVDAVERINYAFTCLFILEAVLKVCLHHSGGRGAWGRLRAGLPAPLLDSACKGQAAATP